MNVLSHTSQCRESTDSLSYCPPPHLVIQLFVELAQLCLTLVLLHVCQANPQHVWRGRWLVIDDVVQRLHLSVGLLLVKLLFHWHTLSCGRHKSGHHI